MSPAIATGYENVQFSPPDNAPYQRVQLIPDTPDNSTFGDDYYREKGEFQVFLAYPRNTGPALAMDRAVSLQNHFKRGSSFQEGNVVVHILKTPSIAGSIVTQDRYVVPVIIKYEAEVLPL